MNSESGTVLPFALPDRWIVTVESKCELVRVRRRTRWFVVARRKGEEDRRYPCRTRSDAAQIAEWLREGFDLQRFAQEAQAMLDRLPPIQRERAMSRLWALAEEDSER